jgi:hypothetical protein
MLHKFRGNSFIVETKRMSIVRTGLLPELAKFVRTHPLRRWLRLTTRFVLVLLVWARLEDKSEQVTCHTRDPPTSGACSSQFHHPLSITNVNYSETRRKRLKGTLRQKSCTEVPALRPRLRPRRLAGNLQTDMSQAVLIGNLPF